VTGSLAADIECLFKQLANCSHDLNPELDCHSPTPLTGDARYSNYAFPVLSHLLTSLRGRNATWSQVLRDEILGPMGMQSTNERAAFLDSACYTGPCGYAQYGECNYKLKCNNTFSKRAAVGYTVKDGELKRTADEGSDQAVKGGSGVLWSTLDDQLIWLGYNMGLKYDNWKQEMIDILPELHTARDGTFGLAWETLNWDGAKVISKGGAVSGFHAFIAFNPSRGTGVVVLVNSSLKAQEIAQKILAVL
jgi:CubicO group peptidase (beta-lactamase class C family)